MRGCRVIRVMVGVASLSILAAPGQGQTTWSDDFEDGVIDSSLWAIGGAKRGIGGFGSGNWQWTHSEVPAADGYLEARLWGPASGGSYGGDVWIRTVADYNDGGTYCVNFEWSLETEQALNAQGLAVQITDGTLYTGGDIKWPIPGRVVDPGWVTVGWSGNTPDTPPTTWSVLIDGQSDTASVYDGPDGTGNLLDPETVALDPSRPWYLRLVYFDGTSAGLGWGDNYLRFYNVESLPESVNQDPVCDAGGPYTAECEGIATDVPLDGSRSSDPDGDPLTFLWTTDCPGGTFDDETSEMPILTVDTAPGCDVNCNVTLTVDDGNGGADSCSTTVTISGSPTVPTVSEWGMVVLTLLLLAGLTLVFRGRRTATA